MASNYFKIKRTSLPVDVRRLMARFRVVSSLMFFFEGGGGGEGWGGGGQWDLFLPFYSVQACSCSRANSEYFAFTFWMIQPVTESRFYSIPLVKRRQVLNLLFVCHCL